MKLLYNKPITIFAEQLVTKVTALKTFSAEINNINYEATKASIDRIAQSTLYLNKSQSSRLLVDCVEHLAAAKTIEDTKITVSALVDYLQSEINSNNLTYISCYSSLIVIADNNINDLNSIKETLDLYGRKFITVSSGKEVLDILAKENVSLLVLSTKLVDIDGRDLLLTIKNKQEYTNLPIIILTDDISDNLRLECHALGAESIIAKPIDSSVISAAISSRLQTIIQSYYESRIDQLTGLPNRTSLYETYSRLHDLSSRDKLPLSLAILDLDKFKDINDNYGHNTGDNVLQKMSETIIKTLRSSDFVARWGGDEFVILFPNTDEKGAAIALGKVLKALDTTKFTNKDNYNFFVSFSAGAIQVCKGMSIEECISSADKSLYVAKASGRRKVFIESDRLPIIPDND